MKPENKPEARPRTVKARVRPNNKYGSAPAGSIVEVEPEELARISHCLISLEDERRQVAEEAAKPTTPDRTRQELEGYRSMFRAQYEATKKAAALRDEQESASKAAEARKLRGE